MSDLSTEFTTNFTTNSTNKFSSDFKTGFETEFMSKSPPAFTSLRVEINTAERAYHQLKQIISMDAEELWVLALDPRKALIEKRMAFRGTVDSCLVHPRDIFRFAYAANASSVIVAHSHPSGDLMPSEQDVLFTQELIRASRFLQVPVVDHLIIAPHGYSSFANEGWCRFKNPTSKS